MYLLVKVLVDPKGDRVCRVVWLKGLPEADGVTYYVLVGALLQYFCHLLGLHYSEQNITAFDEQIVDTPLLLFIWLVSDERKGS